MAHIVRSTNDRACVNKFGLDALLTNHLKFGNRQFVMLADKGFTTGHAIICNYQEVANPSRARRLYNLCHNHHR